MRIDIEGEDLIRAAGDPAAKRIIRSAAYFLLAAIGDIPDETESPFERNADGSPVVVPTGTNEDHRPGAMPAPFVPAAATAAGAPVATEVADAALKTVLAVSAPPPPPVADMRFGSNPDYVPPPPPADSETGAPNTGKVPPPPPTLNGTGANTAEVPSPPTTPLAANAGGAPAVVSAEVDAAGLPWDERIHQKGKSKKKDNTWKLKKGIDPAVVVAVTAELAARKAASTAPTAGSLPPASTPLGANTVPVPPVPNGTPVVAVSPQNGVGSSVPVPPAPAVGLVGSSDAHTPYRKLIDKITDLTKGGKLTPAKVSEICTSHGSPSLMALKQFEALIPAVDKDIDAAALGLM